MAHGSATVGDAPAVTEQFVLEQRMITVSATHHHSLWTTAFVGEAGFIPYPARDDLHIEADLPAEDPIFGAFDAPLKMGMIAIEPEARRRMRPTAAPTCADTDCSYMLIKLNLIL